MDPLIQTAVKEKLQRGLSYPLGAQQISVNLAGIPQYSEIRLCFYGRHGNRIAYFVPDTSRHFIALKGAASHNTRLMGFREVMIGRWWDDFWSIAVFGVHSKIRNVAKKGLLGAALPELKSWLCDDRTETWFEGKKRLYIGLADTVEELCICELHNDHLVNVKYIDVPKANAAI